jgi:hypothetical protein
MKEEQYTNEQLRSRAIELYKQQWNVSDICEVLHCSRSWFYKWLKRYKSADPNWYKERSKAPKTTPNKISYETENMILEARKELASRPYSQYGPQAIYYYLAHNGVEAPPVWTIARTLSRHHVTFKKKASPYISKGKEYPYEYALCQQMDFVGPRYLYSKVRCYFLSLICCDTHFAKVFVLDNQRSNDTCESLIRYWKVAGVPDFLQMDNFLSFWGSLIRPNALGKVIRLCLSCGVTPVFIPIREPWRNGIIEHFNKTMQKSTLNAKVYSNLESLQDETDYFCEVHNNTHHYSTQQGMTPVKCMRHLNYPLVRLDSEYRINNIPKDVSTGEIHVIRFIRSDLNFNIFNFTFKLPESTMYEYIRGVIITDEHRLIIFKDQEYVTEFTFMLY